MRPDLSACGSAGGFAGDRRLGCKAAFVVHGHGGLDELTTSGLNCVSQLRDGRVSDFDLDAADFDLRRIAPHELLGSEPAENARILRAILAGEDESPRRDVVLLNAAAVLATADGDFARGLAEASHSIDSRAALQKLDSLAAFSRQLSPPAVVAAGTEHNRPAVAAVH